MRSLVWFRSDLRTHDHSALVSACRRSDDGVIAVFAICPNQWSEHDWGPARVDFVLRNLVALSESLEALNIPMKIIEVNRFDEVGTRLLRLAETHQCDALLFHEEHEVNERHRDEQVRQMFEARGLTVETFVDQFILDVREMRTGTGGIYTKFTAFKNKWFTRLAEVGMPRTLAKPRRLPRCVIASDDVRSVAHRFPDLPQSTHWKVGEAIVRRRLSTFTAKRIGHYDRDRDLPSIPGTSAMSPYLTCGVVSPRACFVAAVAANEGQVSAGNAGAVTWISELIWREFYRYVLVGFPHVCRGRSFHDRGDRVAWRYDEDHFSAWCDGKTGFPIVDAGMRQLREIGWMHNRLRMIVGMFLTKDLLIDWRWGERFFMRHLVDGDFASNNGGWQWCASTGTDSVPYFRVFNPTTQSRRFDPTGAFIRRYVPELNSLDDRAIHQPSAPQAVSLGYPLPIVDHAEARLRAIAAFR